MHGRPSSRSQGIAASRPKRRRRASGGIADGVSADALYWDVPKEVREGTATYAVPGQPNATDEAMGTLAAILSAPVRLPFQWGVGIGGILDQAHQAMPWGGNDPTAIGYDPRAGTIDPSVMIPFATDVAGMATTGSFAAPAAQGAVGMGVRSNVPRPRTFYRGTNPGDTRRISTGDAKWDSHLFASSDPEQAKMYGSHITTIEAKPEAKILYEGTAEFTKVAGKWRKNENLLQYSARAAQAAKDAGYDAVWFKMQGNVGTAIINPDKFNALPTDRTSH